MIIRNQIRWIFLILICIDGGRGMYATGTCTYSDRLPDYRNSCQGTDQTVDADTNNILDKVNTEFQNSITAGDTSKSRSLLNLILKMLRENDHAQLTTSNSQYYIGVYYVLAGKNSDAINWFRLSSSIREQMNCRDEIYAKCLFNLGLAYNNLGDFRHMEEYTLNHLRLRNNYMENRVPC